ncbi:MAG: sulfatase-like hydrolase/transferase [Bacteroidaceae bacterium]|nr:sulfatase-like hydrolase/transferase [Bacteroidaceae bacterium]
MMKNNRLMLTMATAVPTLAGMAQQKPNILVIIADDMARCELGCYGGQNLATPNIDQVASEGMRMTNNFASVAMSVPIRASMYTGLYPAHHGSYLNHKATYSKVKSVTHYLSDLGYRVGRAGKDHPINQPKVYGFEKIPGFVVGCTVSHPAKSTPDGILEFMKRDNRQPFCLFVCSINSHMPWDAGDASEFTPSKVKLPPNCVDNAKTRSDFCNYLAEIRLFDDEVGMVMSALKEAGADENTLVIVLSEQGPQMPFGKWTCYRYGQSSAMIVRYPRKVQAGSVSDALVQYEDILPTLIEVAGGEPVEGLDGISQLDVFLGRQTDKRQWVYGMHNNNPEGPSYPIRSIQDKRYKLIENLSPDSSYYEKHMMAQGNNMWQSWVQTAQTNDYADWLVNRFVKRPAIEFYDHETDPWELNNLADAPEHKERIAMMYQELHRWMNEQGDRGALMDTKNPEDPSLKIPKPVSTYEELNAIREDLTQNYYLDCDIEIPEGEEWVPIGASSKDDADPARFSGILDGRGHTIKGLTIKNANAFKGLFGRMDHGTVRNLILQDVDISGKAPTGGITGAMIGTCTIERVAVTGKITSDSEAGGIAGRVARDGTHTDYNIIQDCYVNADIQATRLSTNMDAPSCAGGIVGFIHSNNGTSVAKLYIARTYYTGNVSTLQQNHKSGCATGVIGFTDNNQNVRLQDVLVLANSITGATPNYYYSRRLPAAPNNIIEYMSNLYVRKGISLTYYADQGVGGQIPAGTIQEKNDAVFRTKDFYTTTLNWDFDNVWTISEGEYPTFNPSIADRIGKMEKDKRADGKWYDLQGRQQDSISQPGIFIRDGKKVAISEKRKSL